MNSGVKTRMTFTVMMHFVVHCTLVLQTLLNIIMKFKYNLLDIYNTNIEL